MKNVINGVMLLILKKTSSTSAIIRKEAEKEVKTNKVMLKGKNKKVKNLLKGEIKIERKMIKKKINKGQIKDPPLAEIIVSKKEIMRMMMTKEFKDPQEIVVMTKKTNIQNQTQNYLMQMRTLVKRTRNIPR